MDELSAGFGTEAGRRAVAPLSPAHDEPKGFGRGASAASARGADRPRGVQDENVLSGVTTGKGSRDGLSGGFSGGFSGSAASALDAHERSASTSAGTRSMARAFDTDVEVSDIDSRLQALQNFLDASKASSLAPPRSHTDL
jgi:hypothetical protein